MLSKYMSLNDLIHLEISWVSENKKKMWKYKMEYILGTEVNFKSSLWPVLGNKIYSLFICESVSLDNEMISKSRQQGDNFGQK